MVIVTGGFIRNAVNADEGLISFFGSGKPFFLERDRLGALINDFLLRNATRQKQLVWLADQIFAAIGNLHAIRTS